MCQTLCDTRDYSNKQSLSIRPVDRLEYHK